MTVTFILNATIPIILLFSDLINLPVKVLATSCTSIIAICTSILQLNSYQEIWLKYRITCENLLREKIFFETSLEDHICQLRDQKSTKSDGCTKLK